MYILCICIRFIVIFPRKGKFDFLPFNVDLESNVSFFKKRYLTMTVMIPFFFSCQV